MRRQRVHGCFTSGRSALIGEEQVLVVNASCADPLSAQSQLTLDDRNRSWAQYERAILAGLGAVLVDALNACFGDTQGAVGGIVVCHAQGNLFGGPKAGEEAQFIVVALGLAPVAMKSGDQHLRILKGERINRRAIALAHAGAFQRRRRISSFRIVQVTEVKGTSQRTDRVVVGLFVPVLGVADLH